MSGGQPSQTTNVTTNIPEWMQPYQEQIWQQMYGAIGDRSPQDTQSPYGTIAPWNQAQQTATNMQIGRGLSGSPLQSAGQGYAFGQLMGDSANPYATIANPYMGSNPMLDATAANIGGAMAQNYETGTRATRDAQAARAGGYGSSAWDAQRQRDEGAFSDALGKTMTDLYYGDYNRSGQLAESGLNRATQAYGQSQQNNASILGMLPQFQQMDYNDIAQVLNGGDRQYAYSQANLDQLNNDWRNWNNFGLSQGDLLGNALRGMLGTGGTAITSQGGGGSNYGGLLGGLGMAGLGAMFG